MQAFIQGVLNGARDFEQQPGCKAKRWCVSVDAYQWERMFADAYQWARVSADAYQWERCLFSLPLSFAAAVIPHFLLRFLEDSA